MGMALVQVDHKDRKGSRNRMNLEEDAQRGCMANVGLCLHTMRNGHEIACCSANSKPGK